MTFDDVIFFGWGLEFLFKLLQLCCADILNYTLGNLKSGMVYAVYRTMTHTIAALKKYVGNGFSAFMSEATRAY
jgi:pantothenate kinase type III